MEISIPTTSLISMNNLVDSINYGKMAWLVNHEISHMFDYHSDSPGYNEISNCLNDQYNSSSTSREDFCDNSAVEIVYQILLDKLGQNGMEEYPDGGYNMTNQQLFFTSYAQFWCESEQFLNDYSPKTHSHHDLRVLNPLKNSEAFAKAFNCSVGTPMNPENKCKIWF